MITNDDIIKSLPQKEQDNINKMVEKELKKWGGKRQGSGRKPANGTVLNMQIRVSKEEKIFLQWARKNNFDYKSAMGC